MEASVMGDGWSSLRFKSSFVILAFSNRIFGRHSVLSSNGKYGAKWFRDDNFTFLIVFFEQIKGLMVSWMVTQQAEALDKGNSRRPAAMVKWFASRGGEMNAELQAVLAPH
jgi:hypothetical protein